MAEKAERHGSTLFRGITRDSWVTVFALLVLSFLLSGVFSRDAGPSASLLEAKFADTSDSGLFIVPASCPSSPHGDFPLDCGPEGSDPGDCPEGYVVVNGQCVSSSCPIGFTELWGGFCFFTGCPSGYAYQNGQCVVTSCPLGYTLQGGSDDDGKEGSCVFTGCPSGYVLVSGQCVAQGGGGGGDCPLVCSGSNVVWSCTGQVVETCSYQCSSGSCIGAPPPDGTLTAQPSLVRSGDTSTIHWTVTNVESCSVSGTNGDSWTSNGEGSFSQVSSSIVLETIYTLTCDAVDESVLARSVRVGIVPTFEEQ